MEQYDVFKDETPVWRLIVGLAHRCRDSFNAGQKIDAKYYADLSMQVEEAAKVFHEDKK